VQKDWRVIVMDGQYVRFWIQPMQIAVMFRGTETGDLDWLTGMLRMGDTLKNEEQLAGIHGDAVTLTQEQSADGRAISVLTINAQSIPLRGNEWARNMMIATSDTKRVYRFDAASKRFEGLQIWVHPQDGRDVLIFETTQVEYPEAIADAEFQINVPAGVQWQRLDVPSTQPVPPELAANRKPEEVARAFFEALATGDQERVQPFFQIKMKLPAEAVAAYAGLKIIDIGKPGPGFSNWQWWVPYKIQLSNGETKEFRLNVRNDNPSHRWSVDGGF
jgi:hypothetical protein